MTDSAPKPITHVEVIPAAPEQAPVLANLLELYAHDFSEFHDIDIGEDGRFGYNPLSLYWSDPGRRPFLVKVDGKLAGLVLIKRGSELTGNETVWDMAEFFVSRKYRRHGVGTQIAHEIWDKFPGPWEVRVMRSNSAAHKFWSHTISAFTGKPVTTVQIEKDGERWSLFSFETNQA